MKKYTVSEDKEIVLDGKKFLLEKGDKIILNEMHEGEDGNWVMDPEDEYHLSDTEAPGEKSTKEIENYRERLNLSKEAEKMGMSTSDLKEKEFTPEAYKYVQQFKVRNIPKEAFKVYVIDQESDGDIGFGDIGFDYKILACVGYKNSNSFNRQAMVYWWNPQNRNWESMYQDGSNGLDQFMSAYVPTYEDEYEFADSAEFYNAIRNSKFSRIIKHYTLPKWTPPQDYAGA